MKTIANFSRFILITLLFAIISATAIQAASPAAVSAKNIRQKFVEAVMNPDDNYNVPTSGEVEVVFTVTDEGTIDIKKLEGTNKEVSDFVKDRISNVPCKDFVHPYNQYYKVKFRFAQN
jgi:hypothetical protein